MQVTMATPHTSVPPPPPPSSLSSSPYSPLAIHDVVSSPDVNLSTVGKIVDADLSCLKSVNLVSGLTPLQAAAGRTHSRLIRLLVARGADLEDRGQRGETPFLIACQTGSLYAVHALVECGCDVRALNDAGRSAMHYAAQVGALHILHYLSVTRGLGFQCTDRDGNTPLHLAVTNRNMETVKYLLRHKRADVRATNAHGTTSLHIAAKLGSQMLSWILVKNAGGGALLDMKDKNGFTAADHASMGKTKRHHYLASRLRRWSSHPSFHLSLLPHASWFLNLLLPGLFLLLAMIFFSNVHQPLGFVFAVFAVGGFFWSLTGHRISHDCRWPNPALFGALLSGVVHTTVCYFVVVLPRIWPGNILWMVMVVMDSGLTLYLLWMFEKRDPGYDRVGKIARDGSPMNILDIAQQGDHAFEGPVTYSFCASCEIVIPERTKHCKLCESCCSGFDHHCMWLNRCVARNNHRLFLLFCLSLGVDNFLFVREALSCLSTVAGGINPMDLVKTGFETEHWILFLIVCNVCTGLFVFLNVFHQLSFISRMETTYFDASGTAAYRKKRQRKHMSLLHQFKMINLFFTNYSKWYRIGDTVHHRANGKKTKLSFNV